MQVGKLAVVNPEHFINAEFPTIVQFGKLTEDKLIQDSNAYGSIDEQTGKLMLVNNEHPVNADAPIVKHTGKLIDTKEL